VTDNQKAVALISEEKRARPEFQKVEVDEGRLELSATSEQFGEAAAVFGSESAAFRNQAMIELVRSIGTPKSGEDLTEALNAALAIVAAAAPANELEAVLVGQMVAANHFAMLSWRRASSQTDLAVVQANANMANKASRTFTMQMEALAKLRRGGEQVVRHVHVNEGGQAVIAETMNVTKG
jgi:hypothetical protein